MYSVSTRKKVDSVVLQSWKQMKMGELHEVRMAMDWIDNKNYSAAKKKHDCQSCMLSSQSLEGLV